VARYMLRGIGPPHAKQQEITSYILAPSPGFTKQVDTMCGRGFGKSTIAIDLTTRVLSSDSRQRLLFLEPDRNRMENVFIAEWIKIVPEELYKINFGKRIIEWKPNGAKLRYGHRDIRGNNARRANMYRGYNLSGVIDDESAEGFLREQQQNTFNCIRVQCDVMFYWTITTPQVGDYGRFIHEPGHKLFTGTSFDNVYLPRSTIEGWIRNNMSRDQVRREIYGELIALEGRVFREAKLNSVGTDPDQEHRWPRGNVNWDHPKFDDGKPWWLFCDLGSSTGAFVVVQNTESRGRFSGPVWVAVADYCSDTDAYASRAFQRLKAEFGTPVGVVAGADIKTRSTVSGETVAYFASNIWGSVPIYPAGESRGEKMRQLDMFKFLICSSDDNRRFTVARDFISLEDESHRGVRECLLEYVHVPINERESGYIIPKGKDQPLCHVADALLMGAEMIMAPPQWLLRNELAK
jgi:hypothetical protein